MKTKKLRALINRYGAAGVLFVGSYLAVHHAWHHRRNACIAAATSLFVLVACLLMHLAPVTPVKRPPAVALLAPPVSPTVVPAPARLHLNLQDDTQPGPPLPPAVPPCRVRNGVLVFAATYYHLSGQFNTYEYSGEKEETLVSDAPTHLYRIEADGSHQRPLTRGDHEDRGPVISPDGQRVVFTRHTEEHTKLCWISIHGGRVHTLLSLRGECGVQPSWSPNGEWLAILCGTDNGQKLILRSLVSDEQVQLSPIEEAVWSPDGRLYLRDQDHARILRPGSTASTPIRDVIRHATWLDNHTLVGDVEEEGKNEYGRNDTLQVINDRGIEVSRADLVLVGRQNSYETLHDEHIWHRLPHHPTTAILETWRHMTDDAHYGCYRVDINTGQTRLLENGALMGVAPDGSAIAVADQVWVGPYKRGGERVGPLRIVTLASGRSHAVTDPLTMIDGGDWQLAPRLQAPSVAVSLRQAVEDNDDKYGRCWHKGGRRNACYSDGTTVLMVAAGEGNLDMVRLLLRFHANPNQLSKSGKTALMAAVGAQKAADEVATAQQIDIAKALVQAGADLNLRNHGGQTALMAAAAHGRALVVDWLVREGAQVNACDNVGWSALMEAAHNGLAHTTQVLLDHHVAVNQRNKRKETALTVAEDSDAEHSGDSQLIRLLEQAGAKQ